MKTTSLFPSYLLLLLIILIGNLSLCSFSLVPPVDKQAAQPPVEKKKLSQKEKYQKRLQKRQNRLYERFEKAKSSKKRLFLQKKIRKIEQQQDKNPATGMSIASFTVGLLAFVLAIFSFIIFYGALVFLIAFLLGIIGLTLSIIALVRAGKNPEGSFKGLAITGLVVSIIVFIFMLFMMYALAQLRVI